MSNTLGVDFSKKDYGGTLLTMDNSGNVYKGAFDPHCSGTDEKWKVHHLSNAFGANQHEDPTADKYYFGDKAHGDGEFQATVTPSTLNDDILDSIKDRPMTWNLWNVVRHYAYIKYFKNRHKSLGTDASAWAELEKYTKKLVKGIYRTFKDNKFREDHCTRTTFGDMDETSTNYGSVCKVKWTNSFIEVSTILERNAREHDASFVLFTGDIPRPTEDQVSQSMNDIVAEYQKYGLALDHIDHIDKMASARISYKEIMESCDSFRITTNEGVDADDSEDGMRPRKYSNDDGKWVDNDDTPNVRIFQGFKYGDLPTTYVIGDITTYAQRQKDVSIDLVQAIDLDQLYPEAEYYLNDKLRKWVRKIRNVVLNRQILPVYTSMEGMTKNVHELTDKELKSITFQIVPSFYWKYGWSYNEFMIHRVGKLASPSNNLEMYDMLGNVWEWVRDDWSDPVSNLDGKVNPMVGGEPFVATKAYSVRNLVTYNGVEYVCIVAKPTSITTTPDRDSTHWKVQDKKVIKGGAFDQLVRKVISPAREGLEQNKSKSQYGTQSNVGFRPSLTFTAEKEGKWSVGQPVDLFFLFDASSSQDNQIKEMVNQAKEIVKMFAGEEENKDICHVGSALFMGNNIKLMCSKQYDMLT